jgi:hypothetical protein
MITTMHDTSNTDRLDDHFAQRRAQEIALEAEAARAQHEAALGALRNERIRRAGVAALLWGCGIGVACFGASFLIKPMERVVYTPGPERVVTRDVPGPERIIKVPEYVTPKEHDFTERPEYKTANMKGRVVADPDGYIRFDDGKTFIPLMPNSTTGLLELDKAAMYDTTPYLGDLGYCNAIPGSEVKTANHTPLVHCLAIHKDVVVSLDETRKQKSAPPPKPEEHASNNVDMITIDMEVGAGYPVKATVDTGCQFPMAMPQFLADTLLKKGYAIYAGTTKSILADGKSVDVDVIMINTIAVNGRVLNGVEAVVSPNSHAMILLGMGALNRLGAFNITDGKIVFTGEQPA